MKAELSKFLEGSAYLIDLRNKTFLFLEPPHPDLWNIMKPILSYDAEFIEHPYLDKTASGGGLEVRRMITQGAPACIFCSAKDESKKMHGVKYKAIFCYIPKHDTCKV